MYVVTPPVGDDPCREAAAEEQGCCVNEVARVLNLERVDDVRPQCANGARQQPGSDAPAGLSKLQLSGKERPDTGELRLPEKLHGRRSLGE
jgi:hypothetical protein